MSDHNAQLQLLFERTFTKLVDTERKLVAKTAELENTQAALATIHTKLGSLLQPLETLQRCDHARFINQHNSPNQDGQSTTSTTAQSSDTAGTAPPCQPAVTVADLGLGLATNMVIRKHGLRPEIKDDILWNIIYINHMDWYWRLIDDSGLDEDTASELTIAIHLDTGVAFDYGICTLTPYSPWTHH